MNHPFPSDVSVCHIWEQGYNAKVSCFEETSIMLLLMGLGSVC